MITDAVLVRLRQWAATQASLITVYDVTIPGSPPADPVTGLGRYLVVAERASRQSVTVGGASTQQSGEVYVTVAAWLQNSNQSAAQSCRWLVTQVQALLTDWIPQVPGIRCGPLVQVGNPMLTPEESLTDRHLIYASDQFAYLAGPQSPPEPVVADPDEPTEL